MAILYISEYAKLAIDSRGLPVMAGKEPAVATQVVSIGASTAPSAAFTSATKFVRLHCDVACNYLFGPATPTALKDTSPRMAAGQTEFFGVVPGYMVAVIAPTV